MAVNEVVYNGKTLIDLKSDTVTAATLAEGVTAHDKSGNKITGTMATNTKSYEVTLGKATGWVLMTTLDDEVIAHINDAHLIVSIAKISDNDIVKQCTTGGFATNTSIGVQGSYPVYGGCLMTTTDTACSGYQVYYPPNNTGSNTGLGGRLAFRLSGKSYYVSVPSYYIHEGTYRLTFTW